MNEAGTREVRRLRRTRQTIGEHADKPKLVYCAQVDLGGVFEDKAPQVFLANQVYVTVLPLTRAFR